MSPSNGRANGKDVVSASETQIATLELANAANSFKRFTLDEIKRYTSELRVPFDPYVIEWRVTHSNQQKTRGQVVPYADQRAYTDRLNAVFTLAGWTRKYTIHTSANFERSKDQKIVAKVLVSCELIIFGLGLHSATGEEWADNDNAGTSAEAQAFKRACSCFGLGRYLYYFVGQWVDLDERKRPKTVPQLPRWATPEGWLSGLRPTGTRQPKSAEQDPNVGTPSSASLISEIEAMAEPLGRGLYRGLLRDIGRVWNPREIHSLAVQQRILDRMRSAERGLRRLASALERTGTEALAPILKSAGFQNLERVDNLATLKQIVVELEHMASTQS